MAAPGQSGLGEGDKNASPPTSSSQAKEEAIDDELNELLDSALADFGSQKEKGSGKHEVQEAKAAAAVTDKSSPEKEKPADGGDPISDLFTEEFSEEMSKQFEDAMKSFMSEDPEMMQQMEKLAEAAKQTGTESDTSPASQQEFGDTLKQTLSSLAQNTEGLQDPQMSEDEMMQMLGGLGGMGAEGGDMAGGFMPMMQGMMKTLLSKDVLYPSLKEIADKYPDWLEANKAKVKESEFKKYSEQHETIKNILMEFDSEKSTDTDDCKKQRFERIIDLMQKMQEAGQPPKEIVGDMAPGLEFDANGMPKIPGAADGCSVM